MLFRLLPRWETRQLIAASSFILLVACAEKPTAATHCRWPLPNPLQW